MAFLALTCLSGCSFSFEWLQMLRAQRAVVGQDFPGAVLILEKIMRERPDRDRSLEAARQGARIAHLMTKNYPLAIEFYRHIILKSEDPEERKSSQRFVAQIYYENLLNYDRAVIEYEKLLKLEHRPEEGFRYRLNLAKAHYNLNNLEQSLLEIDTILSGKLSPEETYEAKVLKASVLVHNKQLADAAGLWESILKEFPERSAKDNVALNLVVCYEELRDFGRAIEILENMKQGYPNPDFLDFRISRLRERKDNQPGAQGWKR